MSFNSLLKHRCTVQRNELDLSTGSAELTWTDIKENVPCFIDLMFLRSGRDPVWSPEAGRAAPRAGVAFFHAKAPIRNGDRIVVTTGPQGTFTLEMSIDEARSPSRLAHLEVFVHGLPAQLDIPYDERGGV